MKHSQHNHLEMPEKPEMKEWHIEVDVRDIRRRRVDHIKMLVTGVDKDDARCQVMNALMERFPKNDTCGDVSWDAEKDGNE